MLPIDQEVDLKKAARVVNEKSLEMVHVKDIQSVTGYIRGGCSPIGMKRKFRTFIDETVSLYDKVYVSAGIRGLQLVISPSDLIKASDGQPVDLIL